MTSIYPLPAVETGSPDQEVAQIVVLMVILFPFTTNKQPVERGLETIHMPGKVSERNSFWEWIVAHQPKGK